MEGESLIKALWKRIRLLQKSFPKSHYSQFGEDIVLRHLLKKNVTDGFFVDVGCYHPVRYSNTYQFYKKGWRGINIDVEEEKIRLFNIARPGDHNVLCPVSDKREEVTLYRFGEYGLESTIDEDLALRTNRPVFDRKVIQTKTLDEIIDGTSFSGKQIDLLSIDVEGMDFRVLSSLDLNVYKPKIIIVESHLTKIDQIVDSDIFKLLARHAYTLRSWMFYSLIFILPGADILQDRENE